MSMEVQSLPTNCATSARFSFSCDSLSHNKPVGLPDIQDFSSPPDCSQSSVHVEMAMTETEESESRMETDSTVEEPEVETETESLGESDKPPSSQPSDQAMSIPELIPAPVTAQDERSQPCAEEADTGVTPIAPGEDLGPVPDLVPDSDILNSGKSSPTQKNKRKRTLEDIVRQMKEETPQDGEDSNDTFNEEDMLNRLDKSPGTDEPSELDSSMSQSGEPPAKDFPGSNIGEKVPVSSSLLPSLSHQAQLLASSIKDDPSLSQFLPPGILPSQINPYLFPYSMSGLAPSPFLPSHMDQNGLVSKIFPMVGSPFGTPESEKDYLKCQFCERTFRRQKNLENHIENAHQGKAKTKRRSEGNQGDMYFKCTHCPYTTKHQSNLYVHLRIHTGERPYICGACGVQYSQSHSLKSHIINKHDGMMTYYIKEKRTRSPRGMGYLTTQSPQEMRYPVPTNSLLAIQQSSDVTVRTPDRGSANQMAREQLLKQEQPTPELLRNGHNVRHLSGSEKPAIGHHTPNGWQQRDVFPNTPKEEVSRESGGAMDLTKKPIKGDSKFDDELQKTVAMCLQNGNNNNCNHAWKLKALRRNVLRMLSILVPNLNFEEKGISAEGDSIDELLQDVIESNTQEPAADE